MWHNPILSELKNIQLKIPIGAYAVNHYLPGNLNLTQKVRSYKDFLPEYWCLPHPSPVNRFWRSKSPWFEKEVVSNSQSTIAEILV